MRKNSIKNIRINAEVQRELSRIIQKEIKDPRIHPMTTVVLAQVTPDLKYCKAYISVLGDEEAQKNTMEGLKKAKPYIRHMLAQSVNLRVTPELIFVPDQSIEYGVHMTGLIDELSRELEGKEPAQSSEGVDGDGRHRREPEAVSGVQREAEATEAEEAEAITAEEPETISTEVQGTKEAEAVTAKVQETEAVSAEAQRTKEAEAVTAEAQEAMAGEERVWTE